MKYVFHPVSASWDPARAVIVLTVLLSATFGAFVVSAITASAPPATIAVQPSASPAEAVRRALGTTQPSRIAPAASERTVCETGPDGTPQGCTPAALAEQISLLITLTEMLGPVATDVVPGDVIVANDDAHRTPENPEGFYLGIAKAECIGGSVRLTFTARAIADPAIVVHELLHGVDCVDDGAFNGSPDPTGCTHFPGDCPHSWVYWALQFSDATKGLIEYQRTEAPKVRGLLCTCTASTCAAPVVPVPPIGSRS